MFATLGRALFAPATFVTIRRSRITAPSARRPQSRCLRIDPQKTQGGPIIPEMQRAAGHQVVDALNTRGMTEARPSPQGQPAKGSTYREAA